MCRDSTSWLAPYCYHKDRQRFITFVEKHQTRRIPYTKTSQEHSSMKYGGQYNFTWHRPGKTPAGTLLLASILLLAGILLLSSRQRLVPYYRHTETSTGFITCCLAENTQDSLPTTMVNSPFSGLASGASCWVLS